MTSEPEDLEHVGSPSFRKPILSKNSWNNPPERYSGLNFRLAVDEIMDYKLMEIIYDNLWDGKPLDFDNVINFLKDNNGSQVNKFVMDSKINVQVSQTLKVGKKMWIFYDLNL